jgi:oligopeptide transport system substrate-binding protein
MNHSLRTARRVAAVLLTIGLVGCNSLASPAPSGTTGSATPGGSSTLPTSLGATASTGGDLAPNQTINFPVDSDIGTLDPSQVNSVEDYAIVGNLFSGLLRFTDKSEMVPDLASALPDVSSDGLTYTFHLRPEAKFSNGDPVTAQDVVFSWDRAAHLQGPYASELSLVAGYADVAKKGSTTTHLSGLSASDAQTVVVTLDHAAGYFLTQVASYPLATAILDQKVVAGNDQNWWTDPSTAVGSGPYRLSARVPKQSLDFEVNPAWWGDTKPTVTKIHIDVLSDLAAGIAKYEQNGYDLVGYAGMNLNFPAADVLRISKAQNAAELHTQAVPVTLWVGLNFEKGPFVGMTGTGKDLRRAFAYAIDQQQLVNIACAGGLLCSGANGGLLTKGVQGYLGDNADPLATFDSAQAKSLLASADPDGSKTKGLVYTTSGSALDKALAENLQAQWEQNLGVHVDIQEMDSTQFVQRRVKHEFVMLRAGWFADYDHPQDWFDNLFVTGAGNGVDGYSNPQLDSLVKSADGMALDQALPLYKQASQILIDDVRYIPMIYQNGAFLAKPYVSGVGQNTFTDFSWSDLKVLAH